MAFLRAVDAVEANACGMVVVKDFDGIAVENRDDGAGEIGCLDLAENEKNS